MDKLTYIATDNTLQNIKNKISTLLSADEVDMIINKIQNGEFNTIIEKEYGSVLLGNRNGTVTVTGSGVGYFVPSYYPNFTIDGQSINNICLPNVGFEFNNNISVSYSQNGNSGYIFYVIYLY